MKLNLIIFASALSSKVSLFDDRQELMHRMKGGYDVKYIFPEELDTPLPPGATMIFVGSGGVEEMVAANIDKLPKYVLLIADGLKNSLAASLEILSWMRMEGRQGRVLHGDIDFIMKGIADYVASHEALERLSGKRVGVIGKPSGWLIASGVDYDSVYGAWGVQLVDLPLNEVVDNFHTVSDDEVKDDVEKFQNGASGIVEPSKNDLFLAMRLYVSVKRMCSKYSLDAFTLNCFDLIPLTRTTGCLALALLNDEGVTAGCEGDIQTVLTMLAAKAVTDKPSFMANPSQIIDHERHEIIFAHCTIAPRLTDRYVIRSHYESLSGVALEGILNSSPMTVVKCGGRSMEHYFISGATLVECTANPNMCRTQMLLQLDEALDYFLERPIGNHHVIVKGDCRKSMESMLNMLGAKP